MNKPKAPNHDQRLQSYQRYLQAFIDYLKALPAEEFDQSSLLPPESSGPRCIMGHVPLWLGYKSVAEVPYRDEGGFYTGLAARTFGWSENSAKKVLLWDSLEVDLPTAIARLEAIAAGGPILAEKELKELKELQS